MAEVSVIVPNYNHFAFLKQRIDSIINQTYHDFELIILDDCSKDNSRTIIEEYRHHPKVTGILYNESNSGSTFRQWKKGIGHATGKYIWIAESDDVADLAFLEETIRIFNSFPEVGIVGCNFCYIDENNNVSYKSFEDKNFDESLKGEFFIRQYMTTRNRLSNASGVVFKKELAHGFDKEVLNMRYCGDWLFWVQLIQKTNIFILSRQLNFFRRHSNNVSFKAERQGLYFIEGLKVYQRILKYYKGGLFKINQYDRAWAAKLVTARLQIAPLFKILLQLAARPQIAALFFYYKFRGQQ